jgi:hypothetical protein
MTPHDKILVRGLEAWRRQRLEAIECEMRELAEDFRASEDALAIAHRNPGQVAKDVIEFAWERLNRTAVEMEQLEREHERLMRLTVPELAVEFKRDGGGTSGVREYLH